MPRVFATVFSALLYFCMLAQAEPLWVAVGYGGRRISSSDGMHWENDQRWNGDSNEAGQALVAIAHGKATSAKTARFIAVGGGANTGRMLASEDGKKWIELPQRQGRMGTIAFGQGRFVAVHGFEVLYSQDGEQFVVGAKLDWTGTIHPRKTVFGQGEAGGMFVTIGQVDLPDETQSVSWRSATPDGEHFAKAEHHAPEARDIAFGSGHFVVVGPAGLIESSHDGVTWQRCETDPAEDFQDVAWTGKRFIARGKAAWTSLDGLTWSREPWRVPCAIAWADELKASLSIHALGLTWEGSLQSSKDLMEWIKPSLPPSPPLTAIASSGE
jgi:hypothetical protein